MKRTLVHGIAVLAITVGSVAGAGTAAAGNGLPLDASTAAAPRPVDGGSTGSGAGYGGSSLGGPISSGSAEVLGTVFTILGSLFGNPCEPLLCTT